MNGTSTPGGSITIPGPTASIKAVYPGSGEEAIKSDREWEPEYRETFSKNILKLRIQEFEGGKYTKRYIETYLEFMHLSGMISNLDYLDFKNSLSKE